MNEDYSDSSEDDIKPLIESEIVNGLDLSTHLTNGSKKWSPCSWQDGIRKSAFQPYKQTCTVLTNLQRGNTQAATPVPQPTDINFHTRAGQGEITELDIKNEESVDICDDHDLTALHWASNYGQINAVKLLIANKANINQTGPDGETPLLLAASCGHHEVVKVLLIEGAAVNHIDDAGNSALMYAAAGNYPHTCNELLLHGADVTIENLGDDTAFSLAIDHQSNLAQAVIENQILDMFRPF